MDNYFKPIGTTKESEPNAGGGAVRSEPVLAVVKNNIDPTRAGRLQVYIADFGAPDPDDSSSWVTVGMMVPFFGATQGSGGAEGYGSYTQNPSSYGMWYSPPDIGSTVVCIFINGDMSYGYYIGSIPKPEVLQMVPAIGATDNVTLNEGEAESYGGATVLPVTNLNTDNSSIADGATFLSEAKPVHSYLASIYSQQGLIRDPIRGPITSSAQRESPSRVGWGVSTPGRPIFEGGFTDENIVDQLDGNTQGDIYGLKVIARRGGHSIVMDDGDITGKDQLVRIRTSMGHQILMSDNGQCLHIIHSNGQSWIELGKEGTIDMYSTNSVNIRTQGDLNLHADNNININAKKDLNIAAENIKITSEKNFSFKAGANFNGYAMGTYTVKVNGSMSMYSEGEGSYASSGTMYVNGAVVNLNTGSSSTVPAEVPPIPIVAHTDTLFDSVKGYAAAPGKLLSIVSRAPAHAPWASAGQGVDVKVSTNASSELPKPPSSQVAQANKTTAGPPNNPTSPAVAATVPPSAEVSPAINKNVTAAMVSSVSSQAAATVPNLNSLGATTITNATGQLTAAVGSLAQTPAQLEISNVLKPGSSTLINGLIQGGANVQSAMTSNLFKGAPGAPNLTSLVQNTTAQVTSQVANFTQAQAGLTKIGLMTGNEAPGQIAGIVTAGAQIGLGATTDFVKNAGAALTAGAGSLASAVSGAGGAISGAMAAGGFAANMATSITGGLGSIATSLDGMSKIAGSGLSGLLDSAKGISGSAFSAITASFKAFTPGIPQNLTAIAEKNAKAAEAAEAGSGADAGPKLANALSNIPTGLAAEAGGLTGGLTNAVSLGTGALSGLAGAASGGLSSIAGTAASLTKSLSSITSAAGITSATSALGAASTIGSSISRITSSIPSSIPGLASGVSSLPGGVNAISSIVNNATGALNNVPGLGAVSALVKNTSSSVLNNISGSSASLSSLAGPSAGALGGAINQATAGLDVASLSAKVSAGTSSLTSLVSSGLPPSAAASLAAAFNSLDSGGSLPIKLPTVATNTTDRSELASQITSVLGNKKIPAPNFGGNISTETNPELARLNDLVDQQLKLLKELEDQIIVVDEARVAFLEATNNLPQGDEEIETLKVAYRTELDKKLAIEQKMSDIADQA
jgi:trimeric autotransporter adhesin